MTKRTEREMYELIKELAKDTRVEEDVVAFADKKIAAIDARNAKAKEKRNAEVDELTDRIIGVLSSDVMTIADVIIALDDENVTAQKVAYRLNKLVDAEKVEKSTVTISGEKGTKSRKINGYKLA